MQHQSQHMNPNARQPHQPEALSVDLLICTKIQRLSMSSSEAVPSTDILKCMCFQGKFLSFYFFVFKPFVSGWLDNGYILNKFYFIANIC